jgi:hypothetical protein
LDRLDSDTAHNFSQLFHLNPVLEASRRECAISTVNLEGGPTIQIVPLICEELRIRLSRGIVTPRQGWVCEGDREMVPNTVVSYELSGKHKIFATLIVPEASGRSVQVSGSIEGTPFNGEIRLHISLGDCHDEIEWSSNGRVTISRTMLN